MTFQKDEVSTTYGTSGRGERLIQNVGWKTERQKPFHSRPVRHKCGIIIKWIGTRLRQCEQGSKSSQTENADRIL